MQRLKQKQKEGGNSCSRSKRLVTSEFQVLSVPPVISKYSADSAVRRLIAVSGDALNPLWQELGASSETKEPPFCTLKTNVTDQ